MIIWGEALLIILLISFKVFDVASKSHRFKIKRTNQKDGRGKCLWSSQKEIPPQFSAISHCLTRLCSHFIPESEHLKSYGKLRVRQKWPYFDPKVDWTLFWGSTVWHRLLTLISDATKRLWQVPKLIVRQSARIKNLFAVLCCVS